MELLSLRCNHLPIGGLLPAHVVGPHLREQEQYVEIRLKIQLSFHQCQDGLFRVMCFCLLDGMVVWLAGWLFWFGGITAVVAALFFLFVLFCFEVESHHIAQVGLNLRIFLLRSPELGDYKSMPPPWLWVRLLRGLGRNVNK